MKVSARNVFRGRVTKIEFGGINAEVTLEISPEVTIVSTITADSAEKLKLAPGDQAYAVIKASSVMVAID